MTPLNIKQTLALGPISQPLYNVDVELDGKIFSLASPAHIRGLIALMDMQATLGGAASHFGGPSAFVEINSALLGYIFQTQGLNWSKKFNVVNDAGHCENGLYALKALYGYADLSISSLKGFRSLSSPLTGHGEHHLFPQGVLLSNGPLGSVVAQSQGLAVGDRWLENDRITVLSISDGACMEGETKEALASIPGLARQGKQNPFVMLISDNNTKLSGRIDHDAFSMQPTFESLKDLGWKVVDVEQGHDLKICLHSIAQALTQVQAFQPWALHIKTIKGYGHKASMKSASGGHGFPLKRAEDIEDFLLEIFKGEKWPQEFSEWCKELQKNSASQENFMFKSSQYLGLEKQKSEKIQAGVSRALIHCKKEGYPIVSITSDLPGSTGVAAFRSEFPDSSIDVGVAESNMVSLGAGVSKQGFIPVVDTFAQFGVTKGALPLTMAALSHGPVIAIFSHTGFQDAADGASHQALGYFSMVASIPHTRVVALTCSQEAEFMVSEAIKDFKERREKNLKPYSYIFFLGRETFKPSYVSQPNYKFLEPQIIESHSMAQATIVAAGSMVDQAVKASEILKSEGLQINVINPSCLNEIYIESILPLIHNSQGWLITLEDHQMIGGFGHHLVGCIVKEDPSCIRKLNVMAVSGEFGQSAYQAQHLYDKHKIDYHSLVNLIKASSQ